MANKGGFSYKRATGITNAKRKVSKSTGVPMTKSGRQRKAGQAMAGGGCLLNVLCVILIIAMIAVCLFGCGTNETSSDLSSNALINLEIKTADILNGSGNTSIGTRAYVNTSKSSLRSATEEQFAEFAREKVEGADYNWFSIICEDGTGIVFSGCIIEICEYGKINDNGTIDELVGHIKVSADGSVRYNASSTLPSDSKSDIESKPDTSSETVSVPVSSYSTSSVNIDTSVSKSVQDDVSKNTETMVWIPTNGGTKYHRTSGCSNMKDPKQISISEAMSSGYEPCKRCY